MTASLLITLRETLEASLVVGIVLSYLQTMGHTNQKKWVWRGVYSGILASAFLAIVFHVFLGGFTGRAEAIYEGIIMLTAAGLISWMIVWMVKQKHLMRQNIEQKIDQHIEQDHPIGIFFLIFLSVIREGVETVIFLHAAYLQANGIATQFIGAAIGISSAILVSYLFFRGMGNISMRRVFSVTTGLLILFAAGLVAHGVHELQEAHLLPEFIEHVWNINPTVLADGTYPLLHEKGAIGSIAVGVLGYNGDPSLLELLSYILYLCGIVYLTKAKRLQR